MTGRTGETPWSRLVGPLGPVASAAVLTAATTAATATTVATSRRVGVGRGTTVATVAFDLVGGLVAFQLRGTRERYAQSSLRSRFVFALLHVQPFVLPMIGEGSWRRAWARYVFALAATVALERAFASSLSRRAIANGIAAVASTADYFSDCSAQRWFGPVYAMKVIGGHAGISREANHIV